MIQLLNKKERKILSLIFAIVLILLGLDVYEDLVIGASFSHVLGEAVIIFLCGAAIIYLWALYFYNQHEIEELKVSANKNERDLLKWREVNQNLVSGISSKIDEQMNIWNLSKTEKDICLLLLKGLSIKEIADIRTVSEKTIRTQLTLIYKKTNLKNRSELQAYFLEDLLVLN